MRLDTRYLKCISGSNVADLQSVVVNSAFTLHCSLCPDKLTKRFCTRAVVRFQILPSTLSLQEENYTVRFRDPLRLTMAEKLMHALQYESYGGGAAALKVKHLNLLFEIISIL